MNTNIGEYVKSALKGHPFGIDCLAARIRKRDNQLRLRLNRLFQHIHHKLARRHNFDSTITSKFQEMLVARDNVLRTTCVGARENRIVFRVIFNHFWHGRGRNRNRVSGDKAANEVKPFRKVWIFLGDVRTLNNGEIFSEQVRGNYKRDALSECSEQDARGKTMTHNRTTHQNVRVKHDSQ